MISWTETAVGPGALNRVLGLLGLAAAITAAGALVGPLLAQLGFCFERAENNEQRQVERRHVAHEAQCNQGHKAADDRDPFTLSLTLPCSHSTRFGASA